jgi:hypothetical protein
MAQQIAQQMVKRAPDHQRTHTESVVYQSANHVMANRHNEIENMAALRERESRYMREVFFAATGYALACRLERL